MSLMVMAGNSRPCWVVEVEGDEETPSPRASTTMRKYLDGSTRLSAPTEGAMLLLRPENQVGKRMALECCALSLPQVR